MRISDWSSDVCSSDLGEALQPIGRLDRVVAVAFQRIVHHLLDRVRVESARRDDDEAQRVADQMDERLVLEQFRILLKDRRTGRVLDMRFDRDRPFGPGSEEQTSELQSLMRISYAAFCSQKKKK